MSDQRLRTLERRWKETGSVDDEAAWLLERVRQGDLDPGRLKLAARLGDGACIQAARGIDPTFPLLLDPTVQPEDWCLALQDLVEAEGLARIAIAAARSVLPTWVGEGITSAVAAAEAWILCPCPSHASQAKGALEQAKHAAYYFAEPYEVSLGRPASADNLEWEQACSGAWFAIEFAAAERSEDGLSTWLRDSIGAEVLPWALGRGDPVAARAQG